ncbi:MAG TPA: protoporphyrinogen oxidase [Opitutales bacterium]|nr:protoporphyrinogen oxidase [Opitutales bacterium]
MKRLLVIGGGLTGLSAAWHAQRAGAEVRVLESSKQAGGVIQSVRDEGFLTETGPNTLMAAKPEVMKIIADLGLANEVVAAAPAAKERFIVRGGKLVAAPMSLGSFLTTPLLTTTAKFRLLGEPWAKVRGATEGDESLADFARRRLGAETFSYGLEPFVAGIFAGDPEKLAVRHALPRLQAMETEHGSIARGLLKAKKRQTAPGAPRLISFQDGMAALPGALAKQLGDALILSAKLTALERDPSGGWSASWTTSLGETQEKFDGVVLAVPAYALSTLPLPVALAAALVPLAKIEYPPVSVALLGYPRHAVGHPLDGFGVLVPAVEKLSILGVLFNSTLFPGRAPAGQVLLTVFVGGARQPELAALPNDESQSRVMMDLKKLLLVTQSPVYQKIIRWPRAIPQYNLGYQTQLEAMDAAEKAWPGLVLAGSYRGGVSMPQCLESGRAAGLRALNLSPTSSE